LYAGADLNHWVWTFKGVTIATIKQIKNRAKNYINSEKEVSKMRCNSLMTTIGHSLYVLSCGLAVCFATSAPVYASQVPGWWGGDWNCNIDGRSARMKWNAVDDSQTTCNGETCSTTSGARWKGSFSDNGSRWVPLTNPQEGSKGGLFFRHADGNKWYLSKPAGNRTTGWTTWNGQRYPLSCWR
jgi:hypothetical protein